jgi:hypothetical protein
MRKYIFLGLGLLALSAPLVAGAVAITSPMASTNLADALNTIINVCLKLVLPLATIIILVAAFFIVRAGGDSEKLDKGKKMLIAGLGGLAIVILGAGSGALLKNIFKVGEMPGITYTPPSEYGLSVTSMKDVEQITANLEADMLDLQKQLAEAEKNGDTVKAEELKKKIALREEEIRSVKLWGEELVRVAQAVSDVQLQTFAKSGEAVGKAYLETRGVKDANGFYQMEGGAKYNPDTKEYIDASGNVFKDTTLFADGSVMCNCK